MGSLFIAISNDSGVVAGNPFITHLCLSGIANLTEIPIPPPLFPICHQRDFPVLNYGVKTFICREIHHERLPFERTTSPEILGA